MNASRPAFRRLALLSLLLLPLGACRSSGTSQLTWTGGEGSEIELDSGGIALQSDLKLNNAASERRGDRLYVQLELANRRYGNLAFEWKLEWMDDKGFLLPSPDSWKSEVVGGRGTRTVSGIAPTSAATRWRLAARRPNTVH